MEWYDPLFCSLSFFFTARMSPPRSLPGSLRGFVAARAVVQPGAESPGGVHARMSRIKMRGCSAMPCVCIALRAASSNGDCTCVGETLGGIDARRATFYFASGSRSATSFHKHMYTLAKYGQSGRWQINEDISAADHVPGNVSRCSRSSADTVRRVLLEMSSQGISVQYGKHNFRTMMSAVYPGPPLAGKPIVSAKDAINFRTWPA